MPLRREGAGAAEEGLDFRAIAASMVLPLALPAFHINMQHPNIIQALEPTILARRCTTKEND